MSKLAEILQHKRAEVLTSKQHISEADLRAEVKTVTCDRRDFIGALKEKTANGGVAIISELKQASPSAGKLAQTFSPASRAKQYEKGGSACLSVLTDSKFFQGHPDHLREAKMATKLPVLRKDFIIDPYQIYESVAMGADAILLIVAAFENSDDLAHLIELAVSAGLAVLLESHSASELEACRSLVSHKQVILGINNRDLSTLKVDIRTSLDLASLALTIPSLNPIVAESGISTQEDVQRLCRAGIHCFLVGSALMKASDPVAKIKQLLGE